MFEPGVNIDAQQILVKQGIYYQYLLENEMVTAIAVDGANQKWIGTDRGGVFLFSPDGTEQIYHFDVDNSPLFSNRITAIAINPVSGDVFFGTDKGTLSFRGVATEGTECWGKVYAFPNPFDRSKATVNNIVITGLAENADVKIVDVAGVLVYSTKALGGQAIWDGKNFSGAVASDGVYMVIGYTANCPDEEKVVTKILIIN